MKHGVDIIVIVCIAAHYLARRMGIEESDGESVHRAEEIGAQMLYRPLRYREHKSALKIGGNDSDKIDAEHQRKRFQIKTPSLRQTVNNLSGGNQQKVILGRWLLTEPTVLLLDEPTRGIDVGAKYEIYQLIIDLAEKGKTVIMVTSEMPELLGVCDRILVMSGGKLAGEVDASTATQEEIMSLAAKYV